MICFGGRRYNMKHIIIGICEYAGEYVRDFLMSMGEEKIIGIDILEGIVYCGRYEEDGMGSYRGSDIMHICVSVPLGRIIEYVRRYRCKHIFMYDGTMEDIVEVQKWSGCRNVSYRTLEGLTLSTWNKVKKKI